jgi:hypothetical protein
MFIESVVQWYLKSLSFNVEVLGVQVFALLIYVVRSFN